MAGHLFQHRLVFTAEKLKPDLSKLSLITGFKRLFGLDGIVNLLKGIAKIGLVGTAAILAVWPERGRLLGARHEPGRPDRARMALIVKAMLAALIVLAVIATADYIYQRQRFMARHRMSRQELKDEVKQSEGDPRSAPASARSALNAQKSA